MAILKYFRLKKRIIYFSLIFVFLIFSMDRVIHYFQKKSVVKDVLFQKINSDRFFANELYRILFALENDFDFVQKQLIRSCFKGKSCSKKDFFNDFFEAHPQYFKIRILNHQFKEVHKWVSSFENGNYVEPADLFDFSGHRFFESAKNIDFDRFYFSLMDQNMLGSHMQTPIRPTIRVLRKIKLNNSEVVFLVFNLDGNRIIQLYNGLTKSDSAGFLTFLLNSNGREIVSQHFLSSDIVRSQDERANSSSDEIVKVPSFILDRILNSSEDSGHFELNSYLFTYSKIPLPQSSDSWYLVSKLSDSVLSERFKSDVYFRLFWELLFFSLGLSWFIYDEKKRHQEQVVAVLLRERNEFIQMVSHQLKTPLTLILNELSLAEEQIDLNEIRSNVNHLIRLTEDLLLLAQVDSLNELHYESTNLIELVLQVLKGVSLLTKNKSIQIKFNVDTVFSENPDYFVKDISSDLIQSLFSNLLDNAISFTPSYGVISVDMKYLTDSGKISVQIQDQGPGVDASVRAGLFERSLSYPKDRKGSGLGLVIAKKIVDLHKGQIRLLDKPKGACFEVIL